MEEDGDQFYDTREDLSSLTDAASDCSDDDSWSTTDSYYLHYQLWTTKLQTVRQRRLNFLRWMGLHSDDNSMVGDELVDPSSNITTIGVDRITQSNGAVLRTSPLVKQLPLTQFLPDSLSSEASSPPENGALLENLTCTIKNLDDGRQYIVDELGEDGMLSKVRVVGSNQLITMEEFQRNIGPSARVQRVLQRGIDDTGSLGITKKKVKRGWLRKLGSVACVVDNHAGAQLDHRYVDSVDGTGIRNVRVHLHWKRFKELSSLYTVQGFQAHEGAILTMKFSPDGTYVASGCEDGIVRVWKVVEEERSSEFHNLDNDPSSIYFRINNLSCVAPLDADKENLGKTEKLRKSSDSTCVIFPPKIFRILERPLHELHGHSGDILDLSWSKRGFLLSSSVDKTVRLWQVGIDRCLRVFLHNNYVTCVNFNPVNDNLFISGSIDGKVRIWDVLRCQVVYYIDIREIVTAVCYRPDGKGAVVGTMAGNCRFYDITDNHLHLDAQLCLRGKKKASGKRITGFQFSPSDSSKLLVTSADSLVYMLSGVDIIRKFKGLGSAGSQMRASFTSDGKHIVSVSENSNVCIWNYTGQDKTYSKAKNIWSSESFVSHNAAIAIPWCGIEMPGSLLSLGLTGDLHERMTLTSPDCFSMSRGFLLESVPKVSATWPEETLLDSSRMVASPTMCKSDYKLLKSACKGMSNSHLWGQVIVTAGWDGKIRVYHNYGLPVRL